MTPEALRKICKDLKQYNTAELNDKLYLHFKGWKHISPALSAYTGVRALWLEGNGLQKIENLQDLKELRCLFLQQNLLEDIEGLDTLLELDTLNVADNQLRRISNLSHLPVLKTLQAANNRLTDLSDVEHLAKCKSLSVLDLSNNKIEDEGILAILEQMPELRVVQLQGNPVVRKISQYRKNVICRLRGLTYLDDRPVFEDERRLASAWQSGGREGEKTEREAIRLEKAAKEEANRQAFQDMIDASRARRAAEDPESAFAFPFLLYISFVLTCHCRYAAKLEAEKARYHAMAHPSEDDCDGDKENTEANDDGDLQDTFVKQQYGTETSHQPQSTFYDQSDRAILSQAAGANVSPHVQALAALECDLAEATLAVVASASTNMEDLD